MATYKVNKDGKAQKGLGAGDEVVTAGGTYRITGVNSDGSYKSEKVSNTTTSNYTGTYANSGGSGSSGSSGKSAPSGFKGSATGVGTYTRDQDAIKAEMNANSQKWWSATEEEQQQLHAANEALSRLLNENGGTVGYDSVSGTWSGDAGQYPTEFKDFSYPSAPSYSNRYDSQINDLAQEILKRDPFSYNYADDPLYQFYANMYQRNGERAMRDTLGEVAARTGGLSSSYAGSVAQGSYNDYMAGLNDIVPELYQLAYSIYQDEGDTQRANLEMLQALESGDYTKYLNLLSQYNTDRSFDYGVLGDQIALDRQREQDALAREQDALNWAYKAQQGTQKATTTTPTAESQTADTDDQSGLFTLADEYAQKGGDPEDYIKAHWKEYGYTSQTAALSAYNIYLTESEWSGNDDAGGDISRYMEMADDLANSGMDAQRLAETILGWVDRGEITREQGDKIAASFGY